MMKNARLKCLLEKKHRALALPISELAELENEYLELLNRIEDERKRLGLDEASIDEYIQSTAADFLGKGGVSAKHKKQISRIENLIRKSADNGDIEACEHYKRKLVEERMRICESNQSNTQMTLWG